MYPSLAHKLFHVTIAFKQEEPRFDQIKNTLNDETDWMLYAANGGTGVFMVYSTKTAQQLSDALHVHIGKFSILFVVEMNLSNRQGWLEKWMWDWIDKVR